MYFRVILSLGAFAIFMVFAAGSSDDRTPEQKAQAKCEDKISALVMSQEFVKKQLKAPSTAKFPYSSSDGVKIEYLGDCKHQVYAYVDAQNTFGAMIRTNYFAVVQNDKGTDTWRLLDLKIYE